MYVLLVTDEMVDREEAWQSVAWDNVDGVECVGSFH